jgi:hypothetical protein
MSGLQQISQLASNILQSSNNELRTESEKALMAMRDSNPNELVVLFLSLLESKSLLNQQLHGVVFIDGLNLT